MSDIMQAEMKKQGQKWPMVKLGEVVDIKGGGTPSKDTPEYWGGNIPWVSVKDFKSSLIDSASDYITPLGLEKSATNLIPNGTIVVPTRMAVGKVAVLGTDMAINQDLKALIIKSESILDNRYLLRFLESRADHILKFAKGATVKGITLDVLKDLDVPLPPLEEQKRIAAILDKADAIRRKRQQAIKLADDFLRSVFLDMFGDPVTNPKGWGVSVLADVCRQITVGLVIKPASYYVDTGVPAIRSLNIKSSGIDENNFVYFSDNDNEGVLSKSRVYAGDIVIVRSGQPGKSAVIPKHLNGVNAIDVLIVRPDDKIIDSEYFSFFMNSGAGKRLVMSEERGQIQKHLNVGSLNVAQFPIPPLEMQKKFVKIYQKIKSCFINAKDNGQSELFGSLSTKAFSGEL